MAEEVIVEGVDLAIERLLRIEVRAPKAGVDAIRIEMTSAFAQSQVEVPRRTNALATTGRVYPEGDGVVISYGPVPYARIVHYNNRKPPPEGPRHHPPTKAYYALDPMLAFSDRMRDTAADAMIAEANA